MASRRPSSVRPPRWFHFLFARDGTSISIFRIIYTLLAPFLFLSFLLTYNQYCRFRNTSLFFPFISFSILVISLFNYKHLFQFTKLTINITFILVEYLYLRILFYIIETCPVGSIPALLLANSTVFTIFWSLSVSFLFTFLMLLIITVIEFAHLCSLIDQITPYSPYSRSILFFFVALCTSILAGMRFNKVDKGVRISGLFILFFIDFAISWRSAFPQFKSIFRLLAQWNYSSSQIQLLVSCLLLLCWFCPAISTVSVKDILPFSFFFSIYSSVFVNLIYFVINYDTFTIWTFSEYYSFPSILLTHALLAVLNIGTIVCAFRLGKDIEQETDDNPNEPNEEL